MVYVQEISGGTPTVAGVATAVPAFIGYTQKAPRLNQPLLVNSMADYEQSFGEGSTGFLLYESVRLFYDNGGGPCYVVSVGDYSDGNVDAAKFTAGLNAIKEQSGVTMLVIPELVLLDLADYTQLIQAMLAQCGALGDRVAILDVYGGGTVQTQVELDQVIAQFRNAAGTESLSYGAAYFPFFQTSYGVLPPSGAMAGVFTMVDANRGVWNAPANVGLVAVDHPTYKLSDTQQNELSVSPADGKSVNAIRWFNPEGTMVWGARTLDGNSLDYRYIQVRRTIIYIEQSIKNALNQYTFAANDSRTWSAVVSMVSSFLQALWEQGGLAGASAPDAFSVQCGVGSTMTAQDVLNGFMLVEARVAITHPAEFIVLTWSQQMAGAE